MNFDAQSNEKVLPETPHETPQGAWYFIYDDFDSMENHHPNVVVRVPLPGITTAQEALRAATAICPQLETFKGYDHVMYPRNPRVVYEIKLPIRET